MDRLLEFLDAPEQTFRFEYDQAKGIGHEITSTYNYVTPIT